jgi:membrane associated rhomboid family serine protease
MKQLWHSTVGALGPGVRLLLGLLAAVYVAALAGKFTHSYDLYHWLPLNGADFWAGQYWRVLTYPLLPAGFSDFALSCIAIGCLGAMLERTWSVVQFLVYCVIVVTTTGVAVILLRPSGISPMFGAGPLVFGLLAAWGWANRGGLDFSNAFNQLTMAHLALLAGAINLVMACFRGGLANTLINAAGALAGVFYLWIRAKVVTESAQETVESGRISRLEL